MIGGVSREFNYTSSNPEFLIFNEEDDIYKITLRYELLDIENEVPDAKSYTVTYDDGVIGVTVFPTYSFEGLKEGELTPNFPNEMELIRDGYTFMGWTPAINPVVRGDDADDDNEIWYNATWQKNT